MLSMTGYGAGHASIGASRITVEARAINHRFLEARARAGAGLTDHAALLEDVARKRVQRGRVDITARIEGASAGEVRLDKERARAALRGLQELQNELGHYEPVPLALLASVPNLFLEPTGHERDELAAVVMQAANDAFTQLEQMRRTEGAALARDLVERNARIRTVALGTRDKLGDVVVRARERLRTRIERLLAGTGVEVDSARLEHEIAMLADRSDVAEELTRLDSHCEQLASLLQGGDEPVGRRIEFLLQEMGREVNTLGSKVTDLEVTSRVLEMKTELERMREQIQNVL